jgi:hypothetical protein
VTSSTASAATAPRRKWSSPRPAPDEDGVLLKATARVDRYAHGLTKKKGLAGRYLDLNITARAVRT